MIGISLFDDLALDTLLYKDDHLHEFSKKNARFRTGFTSFPMPPNENDRQSRDEYEQEALKFEIRSKYVDGIHVNATYTTIAHYWLIKQFIKSKEWRIVTDEDNSILAAAQRVFVEDIKRFDAHVFISKLDKEKSTSQSLTEYAEAKEILFNWAEARDIKIRGLRELAVLYMSEQLKTHKFYELASDGVNLKWANNPLILPLASKDTGFHTVDCKTDVSSYESEGLARMHLDVNHNSTDAFIQLIRRRISTLERPLVTARGDGKSYIYSNFNPEYAQYALTILRVYFNFCLPYSTRDGEKLTPVQRLGLTKKVFELKDYSYAIKTATKHIPLVAVLLNKVHSIIIGTAIYFACGITEYFLRVSPNTHIQLQVFLRSFFGKFSNEYSKSTPPFTDRY